METRKAKIEFLPDCVVKTLKTRFLEPKWFEYYNQLQKEYDFLVKVYDVQDEKTIIMERLDEENSLDIMMKNRRNLEKLTKADLVCMIDSFNKAFMCGLEFSKKIPDYFYHTDLHLYNIIQTKTKEFKVIDPDSFQICKGLDQAYRYFQSNIFIMHSIQRHRFVTEKLPNEQNHL
jgi:hypothetical protein